ncbi:hypothetical protein JXA34_03860 [Patescibacteria group bacterium]|nr:hypothetical protein [Patescibacteria group bacterium]
MLNTKVQKVLEIDLQQKTSNTKSYDNLNKYIGGTGLGLKLMEIYKDANPIIFGVGPLNGFFPFASKTSIVVNSRNRVEDIYIGGSLSLRIRFAGINAIVICGKSPTAKIINIFNEDVKLEKSPTETKELGLPGKRSVLEFNELNLVADRYFESPEEILEKSFIEKNVAGLVITGTKNFTLKNMAEYQKLYEYILNKSGILNTVASNKPACSNCPLGCEQSKTGEIGGNILLHSLVACGYAENIYSDIGTLFSCLNILGYDYTHEDLQNLPNLVEKTLQNLNRTGN